MLGGVEPDPGVGAQRLPSTRSTAAPRRSASPRWFASWAGPADLLEAPERHLAERAGHARRGTGEPGTVTAVDVRAVGLAVVALGGGRTREDDPVDHSVGLTEVAAPGEEVAPGGRPLALVHAKDEEAAAPGGGRAARRLHAGRLRAGRRPRQSSRCCGDRRPQGRAPRAPRGHRAAGPDPADRRAQRPAGARGRVRRAGPLRLHGLPRLPEDLRQGRERDPHRRGLPRHHLRVPRELRGRGRDLRGAHGLAGPREARRPQRRGAPRRHRRAGSTTPARRAASRGAS